MIGKRIDARAGKRIDTRAVQVLLRLRVVAKRSIARAFTLVLLTGGICVHLYSTRKCFETCDRMCV